MIIPIDNDHRLASDRHQWIVQERTVTKTGPNKGEERWKNISYWATPQGAVNGMVKLKIRLHDSETLTDALEFITNTLNQVSQALTPPGPC